MWFIYSLLVILAWGFTDYFYKRSVSKEDDVSHLKVLFAIGLVMGIHAIFFLVTGRVEYSIDNFVTYLPVSFLYILAMAIGFYGFRWIELSIGSPLENTSGAIAAVLTFIFLGQSMQWYQAIAVILITIAIFIIGNEERRKNISNIVNDKRNWFLVLLFPMLYALIDSLGTFADAFVLDKLLTEDQANVSYELMFLLVGIIALIYILIVKKRRYNLKEQKYPFLAAIFETIGQYFYVHALSENAIIVAPMIATYSAVAVILGRILLKEKLSLKQKIAIMIILISIFILGFE